MTATRQEVEELILEKMGEVEAKPVKWLTRKLVIDTEGNIHAFWGEGEEMKHNIFDDIKRVIDQHLDILDGYRGDLIVLRGQGFIIPGEKQRIEQFILHLHKLVEKLMAPTPLSPNEESRLLRDIAWIIAQIGRTTNAYKQLAKTKLEQLTLVSLVDEKGRAQPPLAVPASEAETELLKRYIDVLNKTNGTSIRLKLLLNERYRTLKIIVNVRKQLEHYLAEFQDGQPPNDERLQEIVREICGGEVNLVTTLERILVKPYVERIRSADVLERLKRAETYLHKYFRAHGPKSLKTFYLTLLRPYRKLATPAREYRVQKRKKPIVDEQGRLKV